MQIKRIADNIRPLFFQLTNWNKEPDEQKIYGWTKFFTCKLDNNKWMHTGARAREQKYIYISIYISLCMKTFLKTGVYIYIYICIYIYTRFQKGFHRERYIDRYIVLFCCTCARAHFSLRIVQLVKKLASTINSLLVRFFVPICQYKRECTNIVYNSLDLHSFES